MEKIRWNLINNFRGKLDTQEVLECFLYLGYLRFGNDDNFKNEINNLLNIYPDDIKINMNKFIDINIKNKNDLVKIYYDSLIDICNTEKIDISTNEIIKFIIKLLDIKDYEKILDFGSGYGQFLYECSCYNNLINCNGIEINNSMYTSSNIISKLLNLNWNIKNVDGLKIEKLDFDKAFVYPPIGIRINFKNLSNMAIKNKVLFNKRTNCEWVYVDKLISELNDNSKVIALLPNKNMFSDSDKEYRNYLINNNLVEGIIDFPSGVLPYLGINCSILILSKNNLNVKVIDGNTYSERINKKVNIDFDKIYNDYKNNNCKLIKLSNEEDDEKRIEQNNKIFYSFESSKLLEKPIKIKDPIKLNEVAEIIQGTQYTSIHFKDSITNNETGNKLIASNNIENGLIVWDLLENINLEDQKLLKYKLEKNDIILTSKSSKIKTAYIDKDLESNIIVTGAMFIVRPNIKKIDPLFLKMFFDSELGKKSIKNIQKGSIIPTINKIDLSNLIISCPNLNDQKNISEKYNNKIAMYYSLKKKMEALKSEIDEYCDEVMEER